MIVSKNTETDTTGFSIVENPNLIEVSQPHKASGLRAKRGNIQCSGKAFIGVVR